jgi:hypothetical protein
LIQNFSKKPTSGTAKDAVSAITSHIITPERSHFYRWKSDQNVYLRRGRALVFSQSEQDPRALGMKQTLEMLEYDPEWRHLDSTEETLQSGKEHQNFNLFGIFSF